MPELGDSLRRAIERHRQATTQGRNGGPTAFVDQLSTHDPVPCSPHRNPVRPAGLTSARPSAGWRGVYSRSAVVDFDVVAAGLSGDLAYVVGYERAAASIAGGAEENLTLRVTPVYRREDGEWKRVHRHADPGPGSASADRLRQAMRDRQSQ